MPIHLELLRTFVAAAQAGTFREAADARHVTKSAISQQIKTLEVQLGVPLFERAGKYARVTVEGRRLADQLKTQFDAMDDALEQVRSGHQEPAGEVLIGAPRPFGRVWLRPRLVALLRANPALDLRIVFGVPSKLERKLVDRQLDLVILVRAPTLDPIEATPIFTEEFRAWASPAYLCEHGRIASLEDAARHRFVVFDNDLPMQSVWWQATFGAQARFHGRISCRVASLDEMMVLAEEGLGIAILPDYFTERRVRDGRLVPVVARALSRRPPPATNTIFLAWRRSTVQTARFQTVRSALLR